MTYTVILRDGGWDIEAPDGTVIESGNPYPFDEDQADLWRTIVEHARSNNQLFEAIASVASLDVEDRRG